jgi:hypothetical protein
MKFRGTKDTILLDHMLLSFVPIFVEHEPLGHLKEEREE